MVCYQFLFCALLALSTIVNITVSTEQLNAYSFEKSLDSGSVNAIIQQSGKRYFLVTYAKMNWFNAVSCCNALNMRLATIENQQEQDTLTSMIVLAKSDNDNWWIGGTDLGRLAGNYQWLSTGSPVIYTSWNSTQPDSFNNGTQTEHCAELRRDCSYRWNDMMCDKLQYPICQY